MKPKPFALLLPLVVLCGSPGTVATHMLTPPATTSVEAREGLDVDEIGAGHSATCGDTAPRLTSCTTGSHGPWSSFLTHGCQAPGPLTYNGIIESRLTSDVGVRRYFCWYQNSVFLTSCAVGPFPPAGSASRHDGFSYAWIPVVNDPPSTGPCPPNPLIQGGSGDWAVFVHDF